MTGTEAGGGHAVFGSSKCYGKDYAGAQAAVAFLTPTSGKKIIVKQVYASTAVDSTDVILEFVTSSKTIFRLYTTKKQAQTGNVICGEGAVDEVLSLTCGAGTFVSVSYDEE